MITANVAHDGASLASLGSATLVLPNPASGTTHQYKLLRVQILCSANTTITPVESGWTQTVNAAGAKAWWRIASASEPSTYSFTRAGTVNNIVGHIAMDTGTHQTAPIDTASAVSNASGTSVVIPSLTAGASASMLAMMCAVISNATWTPPGTATEDYDYQPSTQSFGVTGAHEAISPGSTGSRTFTASLLGANFGIMWSLIPEPPVEISATDSTHAHAAESPAVTQTHEVAPGDTAHAHAAEAPGLTQTHELAPVAVAHAHTVESPTLTQVHELVPAGSVHAHAAELAALSQVYSLVALDSLHTHAGGTTTVIPTPPTPTSRTSTAATSSRTSTASSATRTSTATASSRTSN